jgi:SWI/SNF-related matrix-associated actin-dependent regulator of chromatin subfamily A member 5
MSPADSDSMLIDDDIDEIIKRGEEKTAEINSKYAGLDLDALNNFKSESMVQTWEGEEFSGKVSSNHYSWSGEQTAYIAAQEKYDLDRTCKA